jgi:hypothetical protein
VRGRLKPRPGSLRQDVEGWRASPAGRRTKIQRIFVSFASG